MNSGANLSQRSDRWAVLAGCLMDFAAFPGRYPLALREPRLLFDNATEVLQLASGRTPEGLPADDALLRQLRDAARSFVRMAMLRPGVDHYTLMGLGRTFEAEKLRDHYRMLMRLTHPDFAGEGDEWPANAATRINQANDVLNSPVRRAAYDHSLPRVAPEAGNPVMRRMPLERPRVNRPRSSHRSRWLAGAGLGGAALAVALLWPEGDQAPRLQVAAAPAVASPVPSAAPVAAATQPQADKTAAVAKTRVISPVPPAPSAPPPVVSDAPPASVVPPVPPAYVPARPAESAVARQVSDAVPLQLSRNLGSVEVGKMPPARPPVSVPLRSQLENPPQRVVAAPAMVAAPKVAAPAAAPLKLPEPAPVVRPAPKPAVLPATAPAPAQEVATAMVATRPVWPVSPPAVAPPAAPAVAQVPPPALADPSPATPPAAASAAAPRLGDVQPQLGQLMAALQSGNSEQIARLVDRSARQGDGGARFADNYGRLVANAREIKLGTARFKSRANGEHLVVDGVVMLQVQGDSAQTSSRELVVRALYVTRGGQPVLAQLSGGDQ